MAESCGILTYYSTKDFSLRILTNSRFLRYIIIRAKVKREDGDEINKVQDNIN